MEIRYTLQGLFIYLTMAHYLVAFVLMLLRLRKTAQVVYFFGFVAAVVCYAYRWRQVAHIPMQNLFEVFLTLGLVIYPISLFCKRYLRLGDPATLASDMLIGFIVLFPTGFISKFSAEPQRLPPALQSWLFAPHVAVYMLSYIFMAKAAVQAACQLLGLRKRSTDRLLAAETATYSMVCVGFPLLTLGLILGSWWGKIAWGDYWGWDPKELWSLASWLFFVGYLHFRHMFGKKHAWLNSVWAISGLLAIILTLLWANLSKLFAGLHSYA